MKRDLPMTDSQWPDQRILDLFDISLPIVQAPMAGASGLEMASAVSKAGGLGSVACATLDARGLEKLLLELGNRDIGPLNVNFFAHADPRDDPGKEQDWLSTLSPYYQQLGITPPDALSMGSIQPFDEERCDIVAEHASTVVSFHFGLPGTHLVDRLKSAGSLIMSSATTIKEARWLEDNGCDVIIAQGLEAGGHRGMFLSTDIGGQMGTFSLVPQIADAVDCPVVAAGGISDGRGIVAALALGASAVQIGTAYLFTDEATISDVYRRSLDQVASVDTVVTNVFSGRPTRTLSNKVVAELGPIAESAPAFPKGFLAIGPLWMYAEAQGSRDFSAHYCGQSASLGYKATAYQLTTDLADDAARRMNALWK